MTIGLGETGEELLLTSNPGRGPVMCHRPPEVSPQVTLPIA